MTSTVTKINGLVLDTFAGIADTPTLWGTDAVQKTLKSIVLAASSQDSRRKKDPNAPKRGKSGYLFFCSEYRDKVKAELGDGAKATAVTKELGVRWNALKNSGKKADEKIIAQFTKMAEEDKARYAEEKASYVPPVQENEPKRRGGKKTEGRSEAC